MNNLVSVSQQQKRKGEHYEKRTKSGIFPKKDEKYKEDLQTEQQTEQETYMAPVDAVEEKQENPKQGTLGENKYSFMHGLFVGLGIGCIAAFIMLWITVFFAPQLLTSVTYEILLLIFIYPLIYLLGVGLIALTAGIVREYFVAKSKV